VQIMSLHDSPLLTDKNISSSPCRDWLSFATSADEYFQLAATLSNVPVSWIEWAETIVRRGERRNNTAVDKLGYRLAVLWNGMILLQETKFLCDIIENALRQMILRHSYKHNIPLNEFYRTIPDWKKTVRTTSLTEPISETQILNFSLYQASECISRNWNRVDCKKFIVGFSDLFWKHRQCRDRNVFVRDMAIIRKVRNQIAHSKTLFELCEAQKICDIARKWSAPVDIGIAPRVLRFRRDRPGFLDRIVIMPSSSVNRRIRTPFLR
jgi:hypothetical protein